VTFGPYDLVHLYEVPNDETMTKFVPALASFGMLGVMRGMNQSTFRSFGS
jgi:uncharacterized protein with GYD domain